MPDGTKAAHRRKKREAVLGALFFTALRIASVVVLLGSAALIPEQRWLQMILAVLALIVGVPILFVGAALRQRFQEIKGGEADVAAKY